MNSKVQDQIDGIKDIIVKTLPVERIYLFGSYAYGTPRENSDPTLEHEVAEKGKLIYG